MTSSSVIAQQKAMTAVQSLEEAWRLLCDQMAGYGFDGILYATNRFRSNMGTIAATDLHDALILSSLSQEYMDAFLNDGHFFNAPSVRWAAQNPGGSQSWSENTRSYAAGTLSPEECRVLELNQSHGRVAGYTISFHEISKRAVGGVGLSSSTMNQDEVDALWAVKGDEIEVLCALAHMKIIDLPYLGHDRSLTQRQRQVLELVADGKTTQDIALLIERNPATVEKHLRGAREALDVETTAQAILKATTLNQFFMVKSG